MTRKCSQRWLSVLEQLQKGLLVITASNRQADFLRQQYRYFQQQIHQQNPDAVWKQPSIITDKQWLKALYQQTIIHGHDKQKHPWTLLSDQESRLLWEQIIADDDDDYLFDTRRTAERVRQAASKIEQWLLTASVTEDDSYHDRKETRRFKHWYQLARQQCKDNYWLESCQLDDWLASRLNNLLEAHTSHLLPKTIAFYGFQQNSPAREQLLTILEQSGISLTKLTPDPVSSECYRLQLSDPAAEIKQAALWAKELWLTDPQQRIGIVLPSLQQQRQLVSLTFDRVFCPEVLLKSDILIQRPFDISLAPPLSSYALIDSALMLLNLISKPLPQDELLQFLLSPYISSVSQQPHILALNQLLRKSRQPQFTINNLLFFSTQVEDEDCSVRENLTSIQEFTSNGKQPASQWALKVSALLSQVLWSEQTTLSSSEHQCKEAWNKNIEQMAIYDHFLGNISWSRFQQIFVRQIHETLFQPKTGDCPIQVMGVLEAAFLTFDKIRICGIDNQLWPSAAKADPFIPYALQRSCDMPNATAERELRISKQLLQLFSNAADQVVFSHSIHDGRQSLSVSPLIEELPLQQYQHDNYHNPAVLISQQDKNIEYLEDDIAPKIKANKVKGGSKLLQDIARCQFRAFAHHRLFANAAELPTEGFDALDRGNLVHQILEQCWLQLFDKQQQKLQSLYQSGQLQAALQPIIEHALLNLQQQHHSPMGERMISIEQQRLSKLLVQWFEIEVQRPAFIVKQLEQSVAARIADSTIRVQLDRVDQLEDGSLAIIDYKTGNVTINNWFGERPDEPQLPLYAMVLADQQQTVGALLYGRVKNFECQFVGIADDSKLVSGVKKDISDDKDRPASLAEQISQWRTDLQNLMQQYLNGESAVTPRDEQVCTYCDLHGLCRISEMSQRQQVRSS